MNKFIVSIPVRNPWWKGVLLKRAKGLCKHEAQEQLWLYALPITSPMAFVGVWTHDLVFNP